MGMDRINERLRQSSHVQRPSWIRLTTQEKQWHISYELHEAEQQMLRITSTSTVCHPILLSLADAAKKQRYTRGS